MSKKRPRRGRRPLPETERKDRVVQARVDEQLDDALREAARRKRVTVSQLIRNVLENTFQLVDDLVVGTANLTETVRRDARRLAAAARGEHPDPAGRATPTPAPRSKTPSAVTAWQPVLLNRATPCSRCKTTLPKHAEALLGLSDDPSAPRLFICPTCA